ncbi:MAG: type II secretion system protein [Candidatus Omnitrophota bacterium]
MHKRKAFTLIEVTAVVIIASISAVIVFPNYQRAVEQARDREAVACLRLIQAGERIYRIEHDPPQFFPFNGELQQNTGQINAGLRLSLTTQNWRYFVDDLAGGNNFDAQAQSVLTGRTWMIRRDNCNNIFGACCIANCPPDPAYTDCTGCP